MKRQAKRTSRETIFRLGLVVGVWGAIIAAALWLPLTGSKAAVGTRTDPTKSMYRRSAPQYDLNATRAMQNLRQATSAQLQALNNLKAAAGSPNMTARWNNSAVAGHHYDSRRSHFREQRKRPHGHSSVRTLLCSACRTQTRSAFSAKRRPWAEP